jgi:hypothetical protein
MKTLTVNILNPQGETIIWVRMSSTRQMEEVTPEVGGLYAEEFSMPTVASDIITLGCLAAALAQEAGMASVRIWEGYWDLEPSTPSDREEEA